MNHSISFMTWHLKEPILAIGTEKGTLVIYNDDRKQRQVLVGYHSKAITCSAWNEEGVLAFGSIDSQVSIISNLAVSDKACSKMALKGEPVAIDFAPVTKKGLASVSSDTVRLSINVSRKSLYLLDVKKDDEKDTTSVPKHSEIVLDENYGRLLVHSWYREQYIVVGTDTGYIVIVSTELNQSLRQVHPFRFFRDPIADMAISNNCSLEVPTHAGARGDGGAAENAHGGGGKQSKSVLACCGNRNVLILDVTKPSAAVEIMSHSLSGASEGRSKGSDGARGGSQRRGSLYRWTSGPGGDANVKEAGNCEFLSWTSDGQVLSVSLLDGSVHSLLVSLPIVGSCYRSNIAYLTSLAEITVVDTREGESQTKSSLSSPVGSDDAKDLKDASQSQSLISCSALANIKTEIEPSFCALGPSHVAIGLSNECWIYGIGAPGAPEAHFDYITSIQSIEVNSKHAAVLSEGTIHLHRIGQGEGSAAMEPGMDSMDKNEVVISGSNNANDITSLAMTENFLIAGTGSGSICYWLVNDPSSGVSWDDEFHSSESDPAQSTGVPPPQINEYRHGHNQDDSLASRASNNSAILDENFDDAYQTTKGAPHSPYAINRIVPNATGTHVLFSDVRRQMFFFNAVNDQVIPITPPAGTNFTFEEKKEKNAADAPGSKKQSVMVPSILWDNDDPNVFVVFVERTHGESLQAFGNKHQTVSDSSNNRFVAVYVYVPTSTSGSEIKLAGLHALRSIPGKPLLLSRGFLIFLTGSVNLERVLLDTHKHIMSKHSLQQVESNKRSNMTIATSSANANRHDRLVRDEFDQHIALYVTLSSLNRNSPPPLQPTALEAGGGVNCEKNGQMNEAQRTDRLLFPFALTFLCCTLERSSLAGTTWRRRRKSR